MNTIKIIEQIIRNRRSVYPPAYNGKIIEKATIEAILKAANYAPTHRMTEPWRFKIIAGDKRAELGALMGALYKEKMSEGGFSKLKHDKTAQKPVLSSHVIAICMQRDPKASVPEWEEVAAVAMAVQNMWLTASAQGIGAYWSSPSTIEHQKLRDFLQLDDSQRCLGLFYMGHHESALADRPRTPIETKISWL